MPRNGVFTNQHTFLSTGAFLVTVKCGLQAMPGTNHRYHFLRLPCGPSSDAFGVNHASATIAIVYDVVLCNLLDLLHPRAPLDEWMSDPRYLVWLDDTAFFPYGPDRVDPDPFHRSNHVMS